MTDCIPIENTNGILQANSQRGIEIHFNERQPEVPINIGKSNNKGNTYAG